MIQTPGNNTPAMQKWETHAFVDSLWKSLWNSMETTNVDWVNVVFLAASLYYLVWHGMKLEYLRKKSCFCCWQNRFTAWRLDNKRKTCALWCFPDAKLNYKASIQFLSGYFSMVIASKANSIQLSNKELWHNAFQFQPK